jgi:hypothetical protein
MRGSKFDQRTYACMEKYQWKPFAQLIYTNRNNGLKRISLRNVRIDISNGVNTYRQWIHPSTLCKADTQ